MPNIGFPEIIIILIIALIVVGPGRLPDVGAALGKSIREFRKASSDISDATRVDTSVTPPAAQAPAAQAPAAPPAPTTEPPQTAAPAPAPSVPTPTSATMPAPVTTPPDPADDEPTNLPA
jgi:TatA/E family protein of Tat protein translocase